MSFSVEVTEESSIVLACRLTVMADSLAAVFVYVTTDGD